MPDDTLEQWARAFESLKDVAEEAAKEIAPDIEKQIRSLGKPGKALRAGNAVVAHVEAHGTQVDISAVFVKASKQRSWARTTMRAVTKAVKKRLEG